MKNNTKFVNRSIAISSIAIAAVFALSAPIFAFADTLNRELSLGMSGSDVTTLQTYLSHDESIYPQGTVTGYFGNLTKAAVSNFQANVGLPTVGRVGPATLAILNVKIPADGNGGPNATISNVSVYTNATNATVSWNTNIPANGVVYYSTSPLTMYEHWNSVDINGYTAMTDTSFRTSQNVTLLNLQPGTVYYYTVYTTDQYGKNVSLTVPTIFITKNQ